nr:RNA-directed DNA polymerase, eukaryota [Tanacetum cinerariifolium]
MLSRISFHVLYGRGVDVFFRLSRLFSDLFKTLCLLNYALMIRHDYDITSSLRRGALQVRWDFLDEVLRKFGFGDKWCKWIKCCLKSSRGSILVNGNPTKEFAFGRGFKQGDPLSSFLFILIMKSLHLSFTRVVNAGLFKGISISDGFVNLSHLFYADDAVFVGQWSDSNITTLVHMVNTRTDADLSAAVQNALHTLLPQIREEIREEFRTGSGSPSIHTLCMFLIRGVERSVTAAADLDEIEEVNANCILMANLQQASTSGTQIDKALVYDSDRSAVVHNYENCYDNEIFNMFTQEEQYTELLEPIHEPHQVP